MENINFMNEVLKILLDGLKKQGFSVMLLFTAVVGLLYVLKDQKTELVETMATQTREFKTEIGQLKSDLYECGNENRRLTVRVAELEASLRPSAFHNR